MPTKSHIEKTFVEVVAKTKTKSSLQNALEITLCGFYCSRGSFELELKNFTPPKMGLFTVPKPFHANSFDKTPSYITGDWSTKKDLFSRILGRLFFVLAWRSKSWRACLKKFELNQTVKRWKSNGHLWSKASMESILLLLYAWLHARACKELSPFDPYLLLRTIYACVRRVFLLFLLVFLLYLYLNLKTA